MKRMRIDSTRMLSLAAAPTFALMALVAAGDALPSAFCAAGSRLLPFDGMTAMYVLMTLFHLPPWFGLLRQGEHIETSKGD